MLDAHTKSLILTYGPWLPIGLGLALLLLALATRIGRPARFCPGRPARLTLARFIWPGTWLTTSRCGYPLDSLGPAPCPCPECGLVSLPSAWRRTSGGFAFRRVAFALLAAGLMIPFAHALRTGRYARSLPDTALLTMKQVLDGWTPRAVRGELNARCNPRYDHALRRAEPIPMWGWQRRWAARLYVRDFRDDGVVYSGESAQWLLGNFADEETIPPLVNALTSNDRQQRHIAAECLRRTPSFAPTPELIAVCVDGLRHEPWTEGPRATIYWYNARSGVEYLLRHAGLADTELGLGLESNDPQQRFLCALVATATRRDTLLPRACPMLVAALGDDGIDENAKLAAAGLNALGTQALPYLDHARHDDDQQRRQVAALLYARIHDPTPPAPPTRLLRSDPASITELVADPSLLRLDRMEHRYHGLRGAAKTPLR